MIVFLLIFVSIFLAICICFFAVDIVPMFLTWLRRIHIGRYTDKNVWCNSIEKVALKKIKKMPPVPVTDREYYTLVPKLKGQYYNFDFNTWQVASLLSSLNENS